jgi:hypothetical protein
MTPMLDTTGGVMRDTDKLTNSELRYFARLVFDSFLLVVGLWVAIVAVTFAFG